MDDMIFNDGIIRQITVDENNVVQSCSIGGYIEGGIDVDSIPDEVMACPHKWCYADGTYTENDDYKEPTQEPTQEERVAALEDAMQELILMQLGGE